MNENEDLMSGPPDHVSVYRQRWFPLTRMSWKWEIDWDRPFEHGEGGWARTKAAAKREALAAWVAS